MIEFKPIKLSDKQFYDSKLPDGFERGCDFSFANLYLWGRQSMANVDGNVVLFSQFDRRSIYPFPVGNSDKRMALDKIIHDAKKRGIPCRITGLCPKAKEILEELYPNKFRYHCDEGTFDYVYTVDDLADLKGKKFHSKRNHLNRFWQEHPNCVAKAVTKENITEILEMAKEWYAARMNENPDGDFQLEQAALKKAFRDYNELGLIGLALFEEGKVLAFTVASKISKDTFDVHFEKATEVSGAYAAINCEFAKFVRENHCEIKFLNREEDMGLEGLRKAKKSYKPHHLIKKYWACLLEEDYEY